VASNARTRTESKMTLRKELPMHPSSISCLECGMKPDVRYLIEIR
jgi:hypothetical protein